MDAKAGEEPLHVFDLPQIYQKPTVIALNEALDLLTLRPMNFSSQAEHPKVQAEGVTGYLTRIVASPLSFIPDESEREKIWEKAAHCLAQRSGRTAMGDMLRSFEMPSPQGSVKIELFEPGLTGDDLGLKTWSSAYALAETLHTIDLPLLSEERLVADQAEVLELGAGTGLVGLAAAAIWRTTVILTDMAEIVHNLKRNVTANKATLMEHHAAAHTAVLDWKTYESLVLEGGMSRSTKFMTILAADPIYSSDHPHLLVQTASFWLARERSARFILAYPIRSAYLPHIDELRTLLGSTGLELVKEHNIVTKDDWTSDVNVVISIWRWSTI